MTWDARVKSLRWLISRDPVQAVRYMQYATDFALLALRCKQYAKTNAQQAVLYEQYATNVVVHVIRSKQYHATTARASDVLRTIRAYHAPITEPPIFSIYSPIHLSPIAEIQIIP